MRSGADLGDNMTEHREMLLSDLSAAPYNPRKISDRAMGGLKKSIEKFGLVQPVIWNEVTSTIVGGHQRVDALKALGHTSTDVIVVHLSASEEKALNVALNNHAIAGEFTGDLGGLLDEILIDTPDLFNDLRLDDLSKDLMATINREGYQERGDPNGTQFGEDAGDRVDAVDCPHCGGRVPI